MMKLLIGIVMTRMAKIRIVAVMMNLVSMRTIKMMWNSKRMMVDENNGKSSSF